MSKKKVKLNESYCIDDNKVYYHYSQIEEADFEKFTALNKFFAKDKNHAYCGENIIPDADPNSFTLLGNHFSKDKNYIFEKLRKTNYEIDSFQVLGGHYSKDKDNVVYDGKIIESADAKTFELIANQGVGNYYGRDKNYLYGQGIAYKGVRPDSFEIISHTISRDIKNAYYRMKIINGADPKSIEPVPPPEQKVSGGEIYSKDKNNVFYKTSKLPNSDPGSFEIIDSYWSIGKDKNQVYNKKKVLEIDSDSFTMLSSSYFKDKNHVFFDDDIIEGAHAPSFVIIDEDFDVAKDKNFIYSEEERYEDIDVKTFKQLEGLYSKDKYGVYYIFERIEGADPETFESCERHGYAKDKNNFYLDGEKTKNPDIVKKLKFNGFSLNINNADFTIEIGVLKNNEEVYGNTLDTLVQTMKDIFKENPHPHNAKIIFNFKNKSNLKEMSFLPKISVNNFFSEAAAYESIHPKIIEYLNLVIGKEIWHEEIDSDESSILGTFAIAALVEYSDKYLDLFIDYLKKVDEEHQNIQAEIIEKIVAKYEMNQKMVEVLFASLFTYQDDYLPDNGRTSFLKNKECLYHLSEIVNKSIENEPNQEEYDKECILEKAKYFFFIHGDERYAKSDDVILKYESFLQRIIKI